MNRSLALVAPTVAAPISVDDFRTALRHFASGVTIVTLRAGEEIHGLTVSAFASVSAAPPLIMVAIDHRHHAYELLGREGAVFAVNILHQDQQELSDRFAWVKDEDRFAQGSWTAAATGAPVLADAAAWLDCTVYSRMSAGTHTLFVGEVRASGVPVPDRPPLVYWSRGYRALDLTVSSKARMARPQVVIVGGGFAGLAAVSQLGDRYAVTLVDRGADFEFLPNLHELVSRSKKPSSLRLARERLVARHGHAFHRSQVVAIDPERRRVRTGDGRVLAYDALVVATGSTVSSRGVPGVSEHALALRSIAEGVEIGARLKQLANDGRPHAMTVVGGGFTGIECLGEILRRYRQRRALAIRLIEPRSRLLTGQPRVVHQALRAVIDECDVELLLDESVAELEPGRIQLASGSLLRTDLTLWTAGGGPPPLLAEAGVARPGEWAEVHRSLQSRAYDDIFIAGDSAELRRRVSKQSYHATAMGRRASKNVARLLGGRELKRYSPPDEQLLITFGYLTGFYLDDDVVLEGAALCLARELLFQIGMAELDRPRRGGSRRRLLRRLRDTARFGVLPGPLRSMLPYPFNPPPRDRFDLPSLPRVLKWRGEGSGLEVVGASTATFARVGQTAGEQAGGVLRVLGPRLLN